MNLNSTSPNRQSKKSPIHITNWSHTLALTNPVHNARRPTMNTCKLCGSNKIRTKNTARKIGGVIGGISGAGAGMAGTLSGAQVGAAAGAIAGPLGIALGGAAGAILGGLIGGATGSLSGARLGEIVDARVLHNFECIQCGYSFTSSTRDS